MKVYEIKGSRMSLPTLIKDSILAAIPEIQDIGDFREGGQKKVYPCEIDGEQYALKIMFPSSVPNLSEDQEEYDEILDHITSRAMREVDILANCDSHYLVSMGPIHLTRAEIDGHDVIYFTEEWIDGDNIADIVSKHGALPIQDVLELGNNILSAIETIWAVQKIHRDIKPGNIMRRNEDGSFVLLDLGYAFALDESSLSAFGEVHGTPQYCSPEQFDYTKKRKLDFRSDLFSLGIVLYIATTGIHPFWKPGSTIREVIRAILAAPVAPPSQIRPDVPSELDDLILRMLAKKPHLRFRTISDVRDLINSVPVG